MNYDELQQEINQNVGEINNFIQNNIQIADKELSQACLHLFSAGGKRLRPYIMRKSYELFDSNYKKIIPIASAVEILHTFTLLHDDIMDQDTFRRGIPTVHVKWGEALAILAGDVLQAITFSTIEKADFSPAIQSHLIGDFARTLVSICEGQAQDIRFEQKDNVSIPEYMQMISLKTGELFGLSARSGAYAAQQSSEEIELLSNFGKNYGIAFQIIDDILGIAGKEEKLGKPIGSDIRQGKKTFLTLFALTNGFEEDSTQLAQILRTQDPSLQQIQTGISLIRKSGAITIALEEAKKYTQKAVESLVSLPNSPQKSRLTDLAMFSLSRGY